MLLYVSAFFFFHNRFFDTLEQTSKKGTFSQRLQVATVQSCTEKVLICCNGTNNLLYSLYCFKVNILIDLCFYISKKHNQWQCCSVKTFCSSEYLFFGIAQAQNRHNPFTNYYKYLQSNIDFIKLRIYRLPRKFLSI